MNRGGRNTSIQGFTIVETLIVLAVTSALFFAATLYINGQQNRTDFQVGIRNLKQQIEQVINETRSGYYPSNNDIKCTYSGGNNVNIVPGVQEQGTNGECIFAGKALVFDSDNHPQEINVYTLAGRRLKGNDEVKTALDAKVTALAKGPPNMLLADDMQVRVRVPNNIEYVRGRAVGGPGWAGSFAVALISTFADFHSVGTGSSGSQQILLARYKFWNSALEEAHNINKEVLFADAYPSSSAAELCFKSESTNQSVLITIDEGLSVKLDVRAGVSC